MIKRLEHWFVQINRYTIALMMFVMFILVFANVITRYIFDFSLNWTEELSRFLMIWMVFLGAGLAMREGRHVSINVLQNLLPSSILPYFRAFVGLIILAFMGLLVYYGYLYAQATMATKSAVLRWPNGMIYMVIPIGAIAFILHFLTIFKDYIYGVTPEGDFEADSTPIEVAVENQGGKQA